MLIKNTNAADNEYEEVEEWVFELVKLMEKEIDTFQSFLQTLSDLQKSIVGGDLKEIFNTSEKAETILSHAKSISGTRQEKIRDVASANKIEHDVITLDRIIPLVEKRYAERLNALRDTLKSTLEKVKYSSLATRRLLTHSLSYVNKNIDLVISKDRKMMLYNNHGNFHQKGQAGLLKEAV